MKRITGSNLYAKEHEVNLTLAQAGSDNVISVTHQKGKYVADCFDSKTCTCLCTLIEGTRKEVYLYLLGVSEWHRIRS